MADHGILFRGAMVQALLAKRKRQTRRLEDNEHAGRIQPGDRLWVRENWRSDVRNSMLKPREIPKDQPIKYDADGATRGATEWTVFDVAGRPSIHMPRWASRILLECTTRWVEPIQDLTHADAIEEGIEQIGTDEIGGQPLWRNYLEDGIASAFHSPVRSFRSLFISINGEESWESNPRVHVIAFKDVTP